MTQQPEAGTRFEWDQGIGDFVARTVSEIVGHTIYTQEGGNWGTLSEFRDAMDKGEIRNILSPSASPASVQVGDKFHHDMASVKWIGEVVSVTNFHASIVWHGSTYKEPILWDLASVRKLRRFVPPLESKPAETIAYLLKCGFRVAGESKAQADSARAGHEANCVGCNIGLQPTQYRKPHAPAQAKPAETGHREMCRANRGGGCNCVPPVQEAPRAAVCSECEKTAPNVCMRVTRGARELLCDICMTRKEEQVHDLMMFESTGTPYAGPERLQRPKLAHSCQWPDEAGDAQ